MKEDTRQFPGQQCQDEKINMAFRNLHKRIVDEIIGFCNAWNITIDEFHISADGLAILYRFILCNTKILRGIQKGFLGM